MQQGESTFAPCPEPTSRKTHSVIKSATCDCPANSYGIPPEQVVGSSIKTKFEMRDGKPVLVLVRLPELNFIDDKAEKPVGINQHIGRRPIAAFGNSNGDFQMLEWTTSGAGPRLGVLAQHDDAQRE